MGDKINSYIHSVFSIFIDLTNAYQLATSIELVAVSQSNYRITKLHREDKKFVYRKV